MSMSEDNKKVMQKTIDDFEASMQKLNVDICIATNSDPQKKLYGDMSEAQMWWRLLKLMVLKEI